MSLILNGLQIAGSVFRTSFTRVVSVRTFRSSSIRYAEEEENTTSNIDPAKDRTKPIPVETSIEYLQSSAYKTTYGNDPVWKMYRRNHKGMFPPKKTRRTCIRNGIISTGNPCPICRDEYLVVDAINVGLLKQFISEHNGEILSYRKTGLCQLKHKHILVAILKAKDLGLLTFDVPFREYDYSEYYNPEEKASV